MKTIQSEASFPIEVSYDYYAGSRARATFCKKSCMLVSAEPEIQPEVEIQEVLLNGRNILPFLSPTQVAELEQVCMRDATEEQ